MDNSVIKISVVAIIVAAIFASEVSAQNGSSLSTPSKFRDLTEFTDVSTAFNADKGDVRLVALLSASCGYCVKGFRYMRKILEEIPDKRLKMYVVWEPMLSGDTRALSEKMSKKGTDPRIVYQSWDETRITGQKWTEVMQSDKKDEWNNKATGPAWDVYFLYNGDVEWEKNQPTAPQFWQHQGVGIPELALSYTTLKEKIEKYLSELN